MSTARTHDNSHVGPSVNGLTVRHHVADTITALMRAKDVTRDALAEGTGIPRTTLFRKLNAVSAFNVDELDRIAQALGVEPATFMPQAEPTDRFVA